MTSLRASLLALAAACAVLPAAAQADSISYIKDGDVWLSTPDGGRQFRVTATGGYSYASQADDGTLVALKGERLVKLSRMGDVLADFPTPVSDGPPPSVGPAANDTSANYFHGPYDPEVSPDGTKVAYTYYWQHYTYNYISGHMEQMLVSGTAITHADRLTAWDELGGNLTGWKDPAWVDDASLVRADAGVAMSDELVVNTLGAPEQGLVRWIKASPWLSTFKQPEVNRQATMVAAATKTGDGYATGHGLHLFRAEGGLGGSLTICHEVDDDAGGRVKMEHPTWAPSGDRLAFQAPEGIAVVTPPPCPTDGSIARVHDWSVVVPGATAPDWGPADVPASRPAAPAAAGSGGAPGSAPSGAAAAPLAATVARVSLARALASGVTVRVVAPAAGTVKVVARRGARTVGGGSASALAPGRIAVKLRFTKAARRSLKRARKVSLKVAVSFAGGGGPVQRTLALTLRR